MKPLLVSLLLFVPFALGARYYFVCDTLHWCGLASLEAEQVLPITVAMPDGRDQQIMLGIFLPGRSRLARTPSLLAALDSLTRMVHRQADYALQIDAPVGSAELEALSSDEFRDIGVARAAELASELQRRGVDGHKLQLGSHPAQADEPLQLQLSFVPIIPKAMSNGLPEGEILLDSIAFLGLRFETNSTALSPSAEFQTYATELVEALNAKPHLSLALIGHTDDLAESDHNDSLGLWRAQAVAQYLEQIGLQSSISVSTQGERQPIAPNTTLEGRYLNRRVEARID